MKILKNYIIKSEQYSNLHIIFKFVIYNVFKDRKQFEEVKNMCRGFGYGMGFNLGGGVGFPWMMLGMGILRVLVAVLVIYLIYKLVKGFTNSPNRPDKAMEITV